MSNCSGLTDEALETLANSIAASQAQEVAESPPHNLDAAQHCHLSSSDAFGNLRVGSTSRSYIQVCANVRHTKVMPAIAPPQTVKIAESQITSF